jgi:hypothetical protein
MAWRTHYLELLAEGEAANLRGAALGDYIQRRLTPQELREASREHLAAKAARDRAAAITPTKEHPQ